MTEKITSGVVGTDHYEVGQRVCITGIGMDNVIHAHGRVARFTATTMIVESRRKDGTVHATRRYRTAGHGYNKSVGSTPYGGTSVSPRCTRIRTEGK